MIIDCHCHAGHGDGFRHPSLAHADVRPYVRRARAAGIGRSVVFATLNEGPYDRANEEVAALVRADPRRWTGFVFLHPIADRGRVADVVARAVDVHGFRGIKVHWSNGPMSREIAEVAARRRLPVLYDPRGDTAAVELLAGEFDIPWIIPHLSSFADDWRAQTALIDQLARLPNVFADTSGVRYFDLLVDVIKRAGPTKLLFGSDGPFLHPGVELAKVKALGLPPREEALVTGGNIIRLVGGARRARAA
ncbi:MAG: amidohydrolase family protein [Actinomycetota bacterium]|nr:amidohydrolase family protein [Actinomycetota bacterium]